jgi:hypothetical protein
MYAGRLKSSFASILAFGHLSGMSRSKRHSYAKPVPVRKIIPMPLTMTARDMDVTFESDPELYRALHPIFGLTTVIGRDAIMSVSSHK